MTRLQFRLLVLGVGGMIVGLLLMAEALREMAGYPKVTTTQALWIASVSFIGFLASQYMSWRQRKATEQSDEANPAPA